MRIEEKILGHLESMCSTPTELEIVSMDSIPSVSAAWVTFAFDGSWQRAVYYIDDDMLFTPRDWQGTVPDLKEVTKYNWINSAGNEGIVMAGLPRVFMAVRDEARKRFGERVKAFREEAGLTQAQLAQRVGILRQNIVRIESGRYSVTLDTITRLRAALPDL